MQKNSSKQRTILPKWQKNVDKRAKWEFIERIKRLVQMGCEPKWSHSYSLSGYFITTTPDKTWSEPKFIRFIFCELFPPRHKKCTSTVKNWWLARLSQSWNWTVQTNAKLIPPQNTIRNTEKTTKLRFEPTMSVVAIVTISSQYTNVYGDIILFFPRNDSAAAFSENRKNWKLLKSRRVTFKNWV